MNVVVVAGSNYEAHSRFLGLHDLAVPGGEKLFFPFLSVSPSRQCFVLILRRILIDVGLSYLLLPLQPLARRLGMSDPFPAALKFQPLLLPECCRQSQRMSANDLARRYPLFCGLRSACSIFGPVTAYSNAAASAFLMGLGFAGQALMLRPGGAGRPAWGV